MANKTISMSKIRHLLQLYSQGRSKLLIAQQTGIARNTIKKYLNILAQSGINIEELQSWSDRELGWLWSYMVREGVINWEVWRVILADVNLIRFIVKSKFQDLKT